MSPYDLKSLGTAASTFLSILTNFQALFYQFCTNAKISIAFYREMLYNRNRKFNIKGANLDHVQSDLILKGSLT